MKGLVRMRQRILGLFVERNNIYHLKDSFLLIHVAIQ